MTVVCLEAVLAKLTEWSIPSSEELGSNPTIGNFYCQVFKEKEKEKEDDNEQNYQNIAV